MVDGTYDIQNNQLLNYRTIEAAERVLKHQFPSF